MIITDKNGKPIEIKSLDITLKQLEVFMSLLKMNSDFKEKEPDVVKYWEDLYEKLLDKI